MMKCRCEYGNSKQNDRENRSHCSSASLAKFKANEAGVDVCAKSIGVESRASPVLGTASFAQYERLYGSKMSIKRARSLLAMNFQ
jgi:hypothetical protein